MKVTVNLPEKRYLSHQEAAAWLGVSVDTFDSFTIPYVDFGPRNRRWDVLDIVSYAEQNKTCDSARTSENKRRRQTCVYTNATAHQTGGHRGQTRKVDDTARALGLTIRP
ncbi:MAG: hypothetical protein RIC16_15230 [Rhodospirillales bacterium]